jgi:hypothetical protein
VFQKHCQLRPNLRQALAAAKTSKSLSQNSHNALISKHYFLFLIGVREAGTPDLALRKIMLAGTGGLM